MFRVAPLGENPQCTTAKATTLNIKNYNYGAISLSASVVSGGVKLTWNAAAGSSGYRVYRSTTSPVALTSVNLLGVGTAIIGTSYTDVAATPATPLCSNSG